MSRIKNKSHFIRPIIAGAVTLGITALLILVCGNANGNRSLDEFEPMSFTKAKACSEDGECLSDVVLATGQIVKNTKDAFYNYLSDHTDEELSKLTICFDSPGGSNSSGYEMGQFIAKKGISTCVAEYYLDMKGNRIAPALANGDKTLCNSMCPYVFAAGEERLLLTSKSVLGFHSTKESCVFCGFTVAEYESPETINKIALLFEAYDMLNSDRKPVVNTEQLLKRVNEIPSSTMKYMNKETVDHYRFATGYF